METFLRARVYIKIHTLQIICLHHSVGWPLPTPACLLFPRQTTLHCVFKEYLQNLAQPTIFAFLTTGRHFPLLHFHHNPWPLIIAIAQSLLHRLGVMTSKRLFVMIISKIRLLVQKGRIQLSVTTGRIHKQSAGCLDPRVCLCLLLLFPALNLSHLLVQTVYLLHPSKVLLILSVQEARSSKWRKAEDAAFKCTPPSLHMFWHITYVKVKQGRALTVRASLIVLS